MASKRDKKAVEVASDPQPTSAAGDPEDYTDALARQLNLPPWSWKAGGTHQVETEDPVAVPPERIDEDLENFGSDVQAAVKDITGKDG